PGGRIGPARPDLFQPAAPAHPRIPEQGGHPLKADVLMRHCDTPFSLAPGFSPAERWARAEEPFQRFVGRNAKPLKRLNAELQPVSKYAREVWEFVNLYSKDRGANRFPALSKAVKLLGARPQVRARGVEMPDLTALDDWIQRESKLGNAALNSEVKNGNQGLEQVKRWSDAVNAQIEDMV